MGIAPSTLNSFYEMRTDLSRKIWRRLSEAYNPPGFCTLPPLLGTHQKLMATRNLIPAAMPTATSPLNVPKIHREANAPTNRATTE
jgi:hypothetical protein